MGNNPVISVEPQVFQGHPIRNFKIKSSDLTSPVPLTDIKHTLVALSLTYSKIRFIPYHYFHGCRILSEVIFDYNQIASLPDLGYISDTLVCLSLWGNNINHVDFPQNVTFATLEYLYLGSNGISFLDMRFLSRMPSLDFLDIRLNNITQLQNPENLVISKNARLFLSQNPWHCGINMAWMLNWNYTKHVGRAIVWAFFANFTVIDIWKVKCHTPSNLQGILLMDTSKNIHL